MTCLPLTMANHSRLTHRLRRLCTVILFPAFSLSLAAQSQQYALLIGIGNYPPEGGWQRINAPNDLAVMSDALQKRGFSAGNIMQLQDQQATREGILNTWKKDLLPKVKPGDVVYFQFSGHGQQVADDNGDELDGFDEALVPYDSPMRYESGVYEGENLIRDDEFNTLLAALRTRLGPKGNLLVVIDACHSGTSTRGMEPARGTVVRMASEEYLKTAARRPAEGLAAPQFENSSADAGKLAPMAAFFGSAQNQLNFETQDEQGQFLGSLTYALSKKLSQAPVSATYRGLFEQIRVEMSAIAPRQQPQAEGTLDQELLGGRLLEKPAYYRVVRWNDPASVAVDAGWVQGLNEGAVLGLYPPETRDPAKATPLARGTVAKAFPFETTLTLDKEVKQPAALEAWVYVLEQNLGDLRVGLSLQLPENHPVRAALLEKISGNPVIRPDETPEIYLNSAGNDILLIGQGDMTLDSLSGSLPPAVAAERLLRRMMAYSQAKYLRQMDMRSDMLKVSFDMVPVRLNPKVRNQTDTIPLSAKRDAAGILHFQNEDLFRIRVTNSGDKAAYFTLIDIQPDNVINVLIPGEGETASEFRVGPGQTVEAPTLFQIGPPAGTEMFKLITTDKPIDLRPIGLSRGAATRDNTQLNPLEKLFGQTYFNEDIRSRGGKTTNLAAGSINIHSFTFIID